MSFPQLAILLVIILTTAKVIGELCERLRQPAVLGELLVGVIIGPHVLRWVPDSEIIRLLAEIGAVLLLFEVGLESELGEFVRVRKAALGVALVGIIVPMSLGYGLSIALGLDGRGQVVPLFMASVLAVTSTGITARVMKDLGQLNSKEARVILGAAVVDDVLGLVLLATVVEIASSGRLAIVATALTALLAIAFLISAIVVGVLIAPQALRVVRLMKTRGVLVTWALAFCLFLAWSAEQVRLAAIVGAFAAGLVLAKTDDRAHIENQIRPLADIFVPIFFVWLGFAVDPRVFNPLVPGGWHTILITVTLLITAVVGKLVSGCAAFVPRINRLAIGLGMIPRGEVGLIFAGLGLSMGIIDKSLYAVTAAVVLLTTIVAPPLLKAVLRQPD